MKAVFLGYKITRIDEIWQYEITQYDPVKRQGGLFAQYINTFSKIKQEASGLPADCSIEDNEAIDRYIASYAASEGITLNKNAIKPNPGLRSLAKLALNSFWSKFGQRENLTRTMIVSKRAELMDLSISPEIEITGMLPVNHKTLYLSYINTREAIHPSPTSNVGITAYTTAQARLKLYSYLERRILYCDTDLCIYVSKAGIGEYQPPTGRFLGDLIDELAKSDAGSYISSFVSGGPKFYAFIVRKPDGTADEISKVEGITLNYANSQHVNDDEIRSFVTGKKDIPVV